MTDRITPAEARETLADLLRATLPEVISVYTGIVPKRVPTYPGGDIRPYVGLWVSNTAGDPAMMGLDSQSPTDALRLRIQTQIVAATEAGVYETADLLTPALTNAPVGQGIVLPDAAQQANAYPMWDESTTPAVAYLPLLWTLETQ